MSRRLLFFATLLLIFGMVLPVAAQDYEPIFEEADCPFPAPDGVTCGYLYVPEDRSNPAGAEVELAVAIIEATGSDVSDIPVIYLEGGPGGAALLGVEGFMALPLAQNHDIILFDQRGTGFSYPSLNCWEMEEDDTEQAIVDCRDRLLSEGVDLNQYNSAASAADVEDLRIALGIDSVKLYGISYGTRLALTVMRDYPDNVHSVVIDSVYPPEIDDLELTTNSRMGAFKALFLDCAADPACNAAFPALESDFYAMIERLENTPIEMSFEDGDDLLLYGTDIADMLITILYQSDIVPYLPYALNAIANPRDENDTLDGVEILEGVYIPDAAAMDDGDMGESIYDSDQVIAYFEEYGDIEDSEGMNFSVDCSEEYALNDVDFAYDVTADAPPVLRDYFVFSVDSTLAGCEIWGVDAADPIEAELVVSDIPVLLISGTVDPVTPPASGDSALLGLANGQHVIFPRAGHGITYTDTPAGECAKSMVVDFFADPFSPVDTACVTTTIPAFYTGE